MECRDAIKLIKDHLSDIRSDAESYRNGIGGIIDALEDFAIPAMEKEIEKDVIVETGISGAEYYACPECGFFIRWRHDTRRINYEPGRCIECGQSLKWR